MSPVLAVAAAATADSGFLQFKGAKAQAKAIKQTADYNAQVEENNAVLLQRARIEQENNLRKNAARLEGTQRVATATSGITMSGSPLEALADTYFATEYDSLKIQYASDIEQTRAISTANLIRAEGRANKSAANTRAYANLLKAGSDTATLLS